jgi:hypothetical protein
MTIVAAGVHLPGHKGLIVKARAFLDGQGIHVCPEHKGFAWEGPFEDPYNAGGFHLLCHFNAQLAQFFGHDSGGAELLVAQFGVPMEVATQLDDLWKVMIT